MISMFPDVWSHVAENCFVFQASSQMVSGATRVTLEWHLFIFNISCLIDFFLE